MQASAKESMTFQPLHEKEHEKAIHLSTICRTISPLPVRHVPLPAERQQDSCSTAISAQNIHIKEDGRIGIFIIILQLILPAFKCDGQTIA
ncbi:MAG: hypothetical protein SPI18_00040 [Prevotella sp.]|nr:hypothetical protein [Prevotella sp.]MDY6129683.1 hypothetical protein [Prevotella sp.]